MFYFAKWLKKKIKEDRDGSIQFLMAMPGNEALRQSYTAMQLKRIADALEKEKSNGSS